MRLMLKEFKKNFKKNILFIVSLIITICLCLMSISSKMVSENRKNLMYQDNRTYIFNNSKNIDDINKLLGNEKLRYFKVSSEIENLNYDENLGIRSESRISNKILLVDKYNFVPIKGKIPTVNSTGNVIAVPILYAMINDINIGDDIEFMGETLNVVGFTDLTLDDSFVTNLEVFKKLNLKAEKVTIAPLKGLSNKEVKELVSNVSKILEPESIKDDILKAKNTNSTAIYMISIIMILSTLCLIFIFTHTLNSRIKKYFIFRFSGISKGYFYSMLLFEIILTYITCFIISIFLFTRYDTLILKSIFEISRYDLTISSIIQIFVVFLVILLISILINLKKYFKNSLVDSYKRG